MASVNWGSDNRPVMTVGEVSEALGFSRARCYVLGRTGILRTIRFGRSVRFSRASLELLLNWGNPAKSGSPLRAKKARPKR